MALRLALKVLDTPWTFVQAISKTALPEWKVWNAVQFWQNFITKIRPTEHKGEGSDGSYWSPSCSSGTMPGQTDKCILNNRHLTQEGTVSDAFNTGCFQHPLIESANLL